jgi:hypothetical protein
MAKTAAEAGRLAPRPGPVEEELLPRNVPTLDALVPAIVGMAGKALRRSATSPANSETVRGARVVSADVRRSHPRVRRAAHDHVQAAWPLHSL